MCIESWRLVLREGFMPSFPLLGLRALADGLRADSSEITQGSTTTPPPLMCCQDFPVEASCPVTYIGWKGEGLKTVGECEKFFAEVCWEADKRMGEPAAVRWTLNHIDDAPRSEMIRDLLYEVEREISKREATITVAPKESHERIASPTPVPF